MAVALTGRKPISVSLAGELCHQAFRPNRDEQVPDALINFNSVDIHLHVFWPGIWVKQIECPMPLIVTTAPIPI